MSSLYRFTLDMQSDQSQVSIPVRLGDTNRELHISLADGGKPYTIENGCLAMFVGLKPKENDDEPADDLANYCPIEKNSVIVYKFTEQTANVKGIVDCEIRLFDPNGQLITSPRFILVVDSRVTSNDVAISEAEHNIINQIAKNEAIRQGDELERQSNENARSLAEASRQSTFESNEASRQTTFESNEVSRNINEESRIAHEIVRENNESARCTNEGQRNSAETERQSNDNARASAESERNRNENARNSAETERVNNENTRISNENARKSAEENRVERANRVDGQVNSFMRYFAGTNYSVKTADDIVNLVINNKYQEGDVFVCESGDVTFMRFTKVNPGNIIAIDINSMEWLMGMQHIEPNKKYAIFYGGEGGYIITSDSYVPEDNILNTIEDRCANAIKAKASGEVIRVNDVSSNKHTVKCKARSKNLFNTTDDYKGYEYTYEGGTLTVLGQYINKHILLEEGKTYTFSCQSTRTGTTGGGAFLRAYTADKEAYVNLGSAINVLSPTLTATMPKGYPYLRITFYGFYTTDDTDTGDATYTDIMLEEGAEATGYVPYVDPTTATVTRCGKNLLPYPYSRETFNGTTVQFIINNDRSVTIKGKPTSDTQFDLATELVLPVGTYRLAGNGTNVRARILGVDGTSRFSVNTFTVSEGETVRIYLVALANTEINYTYFPVLSLGEEEVAYEEYVGTVHKPNADGTVIGIKSLAPTMTLLTDTENVVLEIEYNQDINVLLDYMKASLRAILDIQKSMIGGES